MIYEIKENTIIVNDKSQFNPEHILECGQVFRFGKDDQNNYFVISKNHKATIVEKKTTYEIYCDDVNYFINYFDLNTDYNKIKNSLAQNSVLKPMLNFGYGIRILRGDAFEMIVSYIISQNNNIKRIQKIIEKLCLVGTKNTDFYNFPTIIQLKNQNFAFFKNLGAGYRDKFLYEFVQSITEDEIEQMKKLETNNLRTALIKIKGIGPKVASCILLFGFGRGEKFPVDTWIEKVYYNKFSTKKMSRPKIEEFFENQFKQNSGIAQQYLFYYERSKNN